MLKAMVAMLKNAMEDFDVDAADEIMEQMKSYSHPPEIEALLPELKEFMEHMGEYCIGGNLFWVVFLKRTKRVLFLPLEP